MVGSEASETKTRTFKDEEQLSNPSFKLSIKLILKEAK
jgi:hypothetical protein